LIDWKIYQEKTADLFRSLGCEADVEVAVRGARGEHKVDVWVSFCRFGLQMKWVVECKSWKTGVTKEKVLALRSIVEDVGADRGVLMSEAGFQSGAIRVAQHTNITLTSLDELARTARAELLTMTLHSLETRATALRYSFNKLYSVQKTGPHSFISTPLPGVDHEAIFRAGAALAILQFGFDRVRVGDGPFPIGYDKSGDQLIATASIEEFIERATAVIGNTEALIAKQSVIANQEP